MRLRVILPAANVVVCALFVALRPPVPAAYQAELDDARRQGNMLFDSGSLGMLACRELHAWSEWHGGERTVVKVLEAVDVVPLIAAGVVHLFVRDAGFTQGLSACQWAWVLALAFLLCATAQWAAIGQAVDALRSYRAARVQ